MIPRRHRAIVFIIVLGIVLAYMFNLSEIGPFYTYTGSQEEAEDDIFARLTTIQNQIDAILVAIGASAGLNNNAAAASGGGAATNEAGASPNDNGAAAT